MLYPVCLREVMRAASDALYYRNAPTGGVLVALREGEVFVPDHVVMGRNGVCLERFLEESEL